MYTMKDIYKRWFLFLGLCIPIRLLIAYVAMKTPPKTLKYISLLALLPILGWKYIYISNLRQTGPEVFGGKIWWNSLRPVHAALYTAFIFMAIREDPDAYIPLLIDPLLGLVAFLFYHGSQLL
jgi:hypothetical protein